MRFTYLLLLLMLSSVCLAQSAKDYFFPSPGKNRMVFAVTDSKNKPDGGNKTHAYFEVKGDSAIITTLYYNNKVIKDSWQQVVKVDQSEIYVVKEGSTKADHAQAFEPNEFVIFKMPTQNGKVAWAHPRQSGAVTETFEAVLSTIAIDGQTKNAVKVTTQLKKKRTGRLLLTYVDYFVEGMGRYKRTAADGTEIEILESETFDPKPPR